SAGSAPPKDIPTRQRTCGRPIVHSRQRSRSEAALLPVGGGISEAVLLELCRERSGRVACRNRQTRESRLNVLPDGSGSVQPRSRLTGRGEKAMIGVSLSRWTMSYFTIALVALLGAEMLMVAGFGFPSQPIVAPQTLVLVHLIAIGWLSLLISGALLQFVPVLVAKSLAYSELPIVALAFLVAGLAGLLVGFLALAGFSVGSIPWLPLGAICLTVGFVLNIWNLGRTLWSARPIGLPAHFVAAGLLSLLGVNTLGTIFSFALGGWTTNPVLMRLTAQGIPLHAALGLGGWLTFTAMGVTYRLLAMFMLSPEAEHRTSQIALVAGAAAILVVLIGGPVCLLILGQGLTHPLLVALALAIVSLSLYGHDIVRLYRTRKRRKIELNARMAAWALGSLGLGSLLLLVLTALGEI